MKALRIGFIFSIMALVCFLFACAETTPTVKPEKKTTIRIGSPFKIGHILVDAAEKFKELVEKGSGRPDRGEDRRRHQVGRGNQ